MASSQRKLEPNNTPTGRPPAQTQKIFVCKGCGFYQEAIGESSTKVCPYCRPVKKCLHGIFVTQECPTCLRISGNRRVRLM